jgi:hypothetical protein
VAKLTDRTLPCGGVGIPDPTSAHPSLRCGNCFAVVGSVGMPDRCRKLYLDELQALDVMDQIADAPELVLRDNKWFGRE